MTNIPTQSILFYPAGKNIYIREVFYHLFHFKIILDVAIHTLTRYLFVILSNSQTKRKD